MIVRFEIKMRDKDYFERANRKILILGSPSLKIHRKFISLLGMNTQ